MEWVESICEAIDYIEENILEELTIAEIAKQVGISPFYFQKGFFLFLLVFPLNPHNMVSRLLKSHKYLLPLLIFLLLFANGNIPVFTKGKDLNFWEKTTETIGEASISSKITEKWVNVVGCVLMLFSSFNRLLRYSNR